MQRLSGSEDGGEQEAAELRQRERGAAGRRGDGGRCAGRANVYSFIVPYFSVLYRTVLVQVVEAAVLAGQGDSEELQLLWATLGSTNPAAAQTCGQVMYCTLTYCSVHCTVLYCTILYCTTTVFRPNRARMDIN